MYHFTKQLAHFTHQFLPTQCLLCALSSEGGLLCSGCHHHHLPYSEGKHLCQQCGLLIQDGGLAELSLFCGHCLRHPPTFSRSFIPFSYEYPLDGLIHKFKYRHHLTCGKLLAQLLIDHLKYQAQEQTDWVTPDLLVPVPIHWLKRWQRGFNQTEFLAQRLAQSLHIPMNTTLIQRIHNTPAQKELTRRERQHNLRKAFTIPTQKYAAIVGKNIALLDDVVTTTATVRALSQHLMQAGAKDVQIWALARTM